MQCSEVWKLIMKRVDCGLMGCVAWQPLLRSLSWYSVMLSSLFSSFEDWAPVDKIYMCKFSNELPWLEINIGTSIYSLSDDWQWRHVLLIHHIQITVRCHYCNTVNFHLNSHKMHPIACPNGRAMGCYLLFDTDLYYASINAGLYEISFNTGPL